MSEQVATTTRYPLSLRPLNAAMRLGRFRTGRLMDERGAGPYPWLH